MLQTEKLIDPGNEHHHESGHEHDETVTYLRNDAGWGDGDNASADRQPG